jgi:FtsZ-binding cell division protein ZapB
MKESTSIKALCTTLEKKFHVEVTLKEDILTLGNITLTLEELGSSKDALTKEMTHNALKSATKENQDLTQENSTHKPKGRGFGGMG